MSMRIEHPADGTVGGLTLRLATSAEQYVIRCSARRRPRGTLMCEMPALHRYGYPLLADFHSGRDRAGRWHFWKA